MANHKKHPNEIQLRVNVSLTRPHHEKLKAIGGSARLRALIDDDYKRMIKNQKHRPKDGY